MNENFKNSFKGFKVKGIFIALAAIIIVALAANAFNSGIGFYIFCGVVALLGLVAYTIVAILKNKEQNAVLQQALEATEKANAEKAAAKKAFEKQIAQLEKERNDAEYLLAQEKAKAKAAADTADQAIKQAKELAQAQQKAAEPAATKSSKSNKKK